MLVTFMVTAFAIPSNRIAGRLSNGFFCSGMLLLCVGGFEFVNYLGGFDLVTYAFAKLSRYSKKNMDNPDAEDVGHYHDFQRAKNRTKKYVMPVMMGVAAAILSSLCALWNYL